MSPFRDFTKPEKGRAGFGTAQQGNTYDTFDHFTAISCLLLLQVVDLDEGGDEGPEG